MNSNKLDPKLSRRDLLRNAATGAAGLAASSLLLPRSARAGLVDPAGNPLNPDAPRAIVVPGMGAPGTPLAVDSGPSPYLHSPYEQPVGNRGALAQQRFNNQLRTEGFSIDAVGGGHSGNLGAITAVLYGTGLYVGNEFQGWSDTTRYSVFSTIRSWGFDFVCPKVGGYGSTWYSSDSQLVAWRDHAHSVGLGFVPFIYSVPSSYARDAAICSEIANDCGIVVVDMEDEWAGYNTAMANFGSTFRSTNPSSPIIVTGYGDPITRFGSGGWPFSQMAYWADGYAPQWYFGVWSVYGGNSGNVKAAINWADNECATAFGSSFPLCPNLSVYSGYSSSGYVPNGDLTTAENYAKNWKAPIIWWEYQGMTASRAAACLA